MCFFRKLFSLIKRNKVSTETELKEETRIISMDQELNHIKILDEYPSTNVYNADVANNVLSKLLVQAIGAKEIKEYNNIKKFIEKYPPIQDYILDEMDIDFPRTEEIRKLANTWSMLGYKCTNQRLNNIMFKMK